MRNDSSSIMPGHTPPGTTIYVQEFTSEEIELGEEIKKTANKLAVLLSKSEKGNYRWKVLPGDENEKTTVFFIDERTDLPY